MPWANDNISARRATLPPDWEKIRQIVFQRDGFQCTWVRSSGYRCKTTTNLECDHVGDRLDHRIEMLTTLCSWHHKYKSAQQGGQANAKKRDKFKREPEAHPGTLAGKPKPTGRKGF